MLTNVIPHLNGTPSSRPAPRPDQLPGQAVHEIEAVCAKHSIPCGAPDSLAQFMRALHADKHLAMDFWSLVARLTEQNRSAGPDWLLALIVETVTGQTLAEARDSSPTQQRLLREFTGMLAGEDVAAPPPRPVQSAHLTDDTPRHRDHVPLWGAIAPPSAPDPLLDRTDRPRLVLKPETPFAAAMDRSLHEQEPDLRRHQPEPSIAIPLAAYAEENADTSLISHKLVSALLLLLLASGLLLLHHANPSAWQRMGTSLRAQAASARDQFASGIAALKNRTNTPSAAPANPDQSSFTMNPSAGAAQPQSAALPANSPSTQPSAPLPSVPTQPITPKSETTTHSAISTDDTATTASESRVEAQVVVPETLMKQNLISSRVPVYPNGTRGTVIVQAIVTARGTVEPVRVMYGNPELGPAAMSAVATWHYRPYLLNGVPVNVSTTISVNTTGND